MSFDNFAASAVLSVSEFSRAVSRPLKSASAIGYAFTCLLRAEQSGFACAMLLDSRKRYIRTVCLKRHGEMAEQNTLDILEEASERYGCAYFAVAHNHKAGILAPSGADLKTTELIRQRFLNTKVCFLDHYIVAGDAYYALLDRRISKNYLTLKDLLK